MPLLLLHVNSMRLFECYFCNGAGAVGQRGGNEVDSGSQSGEVIHVACHK